MSSTAGMDLATNLQAPQPRAESQTRRGSASSLPSSSKLKNAIGANLLRSYSYAIDPLNVNIAREDDDQPQSGISTASTRVGDSPPETPTSSGFPFRIPKSFLNHRSGTFSGDSMLTPKSPDNEARTAKGTPPTVSIASSVTGMLNSSAGSKKSSPHIRPMSSNMTHLSGASQLFSRALSEASQKTPSAAKFGLRSPCFFHKRFDDAINIDRVIEEITVEDAGMSHSRLMQTATSVREISKQLQRRPIKREVRSVMIVTKARDNSLVALTRELALWLLSTPRYGSDVGVTVYVDAKLQHSKRFDAVEIIKQNPRYDLRYWNPELCYTSPERFDLVLTLGGDGTVLYTSCLFQRVVPPILAFSLGSLGFLTNFEFPDYKTTLDRVMGDSGMKVNLRMRFTCTVYRANPSQPKGSKKKRSPVDTAEMMEGEQFEVLNELVIDRGPSPYVSNLELYGDDELLTVVQADGCIFSTPTGSTAYSLSAGGPLTHPSIPGILLTPICPHTLSFRPMVLSDTLMLKVCVPRNSRSTAYASFDGKGRVELRKGDCVVVEAGRYPFPTVVGDHGTGGEWFESVRRALRWNTRGAMQKSFHADTKPQNRVAEFNEADEEGDNEDEEAEEGEEEDEWDINPDPVEIPGFVDSGIGASEASSGQDSPKRWSRSISHGG